MVKYEMGYNKDVDTKLTISNFKELDIILEKIKEHDTIDGWKLLFWFGCN